MFRHLRIISAIFHSNLILLNFPSSFIAIASSTRTKSAITSNTGNNPVAFQLTEIESMKLIPQPTFTDEAVVKV